MWWRLCLFFLSLPMHDWYVYIVRCRDGSLYTGIATDVESRIADHLSNKGAKYLRGRGPLKLVFKKQVGGKRQALSVEHKVKRLPRHKKEALVKTGASIEALLDSNGR
jgi:putative endonuclease